MTAILHLKCKNLLERFPVESAIQKRSNQGCNRPAQHKGNSPLKNLLCNSITIALGLSCVYLFFGISNVFAQTTSTTSAAETMILMEGDEWLKARDRVTAAKDPVLVKIYEWMLYRGDYDNLPFPRISRFIDANPHWPNQSALLETAERNMPTTLPAEQILSWFGQHPPQTGRGAILLTNAAYQSGQAGQAGLPAQIIIKSWATLNLDNDETTKLWTAWKSSLPDSEKIKRLDKLLFDHKYTRARHYAALLENGYPQLTEARIALAEDKPDVSGLINKVPLHLKKDAGLQFERLSWRRRNDENTGAIEILNHQPALDHVLNTAEWWKERHIMIRRMIEDKNFRTAYKLAASHGQTNQDRASKADAEWLAGWLALRFMNQPQIALTHFNTMYQTVFTAISKSRGAYWAGRAEERMGHKEKATEWYKIAASFPHTYYGQLALQKLGQPTPPAGAPLVTDRDRQLAEQSDLLKAAIIAHTAGLETLHSQLITALTASLNTSGEFMAAADKLSRNQDKTGAFRIAKAASWKNMYLGQYTYPSLENDMRQISGSHALYHAIIRQESQFDPEARSPSGALGLMQLMPPTAKETAGKLGVPHQTGWLTTRPDHNILLGTTYIKSLLDRFDGNYILAIAGYNAGPNRVSGWVEEFGDPRTPETDWIDWVELIPVSETRNYVQRVMENYFVYNEYIRMN